MKDFNEFVSENQNTNDNNAMNLIKQLAKKYEGASESQILSAIIKEGEKGKRNGTLKDSDIDNFANLISPMLNSSQQKKLNEVIKMLKSK